jgi:hypothetical protein
MGEVPCMIVRPSASAMPGEMRIKTRAPLSIMTLVGVRNLVSSGLYKWSEVLGFDCFRVANMGFLRKKI